ncbi:hypothetical protein ACNVED_12030 [Legionella sp. D16C41]|uniref:hypothetical protein n=1 Tax=Legionella sp. D16C41 TaxID=3402688 RepID=UPI003AF7C379
MVDYDAIERLKEWLKASCSAEPPDSRTFEFKKGKIEFDPIRAVFIVTGTEEVYFQEEVMQALNNEESLTNLACRMLQI